MSDEQVGEFLVQQAGADVIAGLEIGVLFGDDSVALRSVRLNLDRADHLEKTELSV